MSILCLSTFISPSVAAAYWMLIRHLPRSATSSLTLVMFPSFIRLRQIQPNVPRSFRIPGKILPIVLPLLGWCSIFFAVVLVFIPPAELDMGGYGFYLAKLLGGAVLAIALAEWTYHRAQKRNAANK